MVPDLANGMERVSRVSEALGTPFPHKNTLMGLLPTVPAATSLTWQFRVMRPRFFWKDHRHPMGKMLFGCAL